MEITQSENGTPTFSFTVAAPINQVWTALRDKERLLQWHGWDTPTIGEEIDTIYFTNTKEEGARDPNSRTLIVNGGDTFKLETRDHDTLLTFIRAPKDDDPQWAAYYDEITEGWISFSQQLRFMLERQPEGKRRTILNTQPVSLGSFLKTLGLHDKQEGESFSTKLADEDISGSIWFTSPNQMGYTIDAWGPGLAIVQAHAKNEVMLIISTYNLDKEVFRKLEERWSQAAI